MKYLWLNNSSQPDAQYLNTTIGFHDIYLTRNLAVTDAPAAVEKKEEKKEESEEEDDDMGFGKIEVYACWLEHHWLIISFNFQVSSIKGLYLLTWLTQYMTFLKNQFVWLLTDWNMIVTIVGCVI